jgi:hypothetical protein
MVAEVLVEDMQKQMLHQELEQMGSVEVGEGVVIVEQQHHSCLMVVMVEMVV